uniref:Secreted protein n=1 Tax=Trichogramma kaykai TaxID=54128 RepID=A0ABD2WF22_9HYME
MARKTSRAICVYMTTLPRIFGRHSVYLFYIDFADRVTATMSWARVSRCGLKHVVLYTIRKNVNCFFFAFHLSMRKRR